MRTPEFRKKFSDVKNIMGVEGQRGMNALSISHATGIPRETTRRKLRKLIEFGATLEVQRGKYVMKPGFMQHPERAAALDQVLSDTARFIDDCLQNGIIDYSEK
jgi:DNA-binding IclR family transcriptional regulator